MERRGGGKAVQNHTPSSTRTSSSSVLSARGRSAVSSARVGDAASDTTASIACIASLRGRQSKLTCLTTHRWCFP